MKMDVSVSANDLLNRFYPPRCVLCGEAGHMGHDLCIHCVEQLPVNNSACNQCALPLPANAGHATCGRCQREQPFYDRSWSLYRYEQPVIWLIQQLKFQEKLSYARLLGNLFVRELIQLADEDKPQCILPVPLFERRLRERGFNQSIELARPVAKHLAVPIMLNDVVRLSATPPQTGMNAKARKKNIRGAFAVARPLSFEHITIVDDVVTTGSTVNELARVLKQAGVRRVDVWSVARAPLA